MARGQISNIVSRRLFTVRNILFTHIRNLIRNHNALHDDSAKAGNDNSNHDCELFENSIERLKLRLGILDGLLWQSLVEEYPEVAVNNVFIRKGWILAGLASQWNNTVPFSNKSVLAKNFINMVTGYVLGSIVDIDEDRLGHAIPGEEFVGSLNDGRVQSLFNLHARLKDEYTSQLPEFMIRGDDEQLARMDTTEMNRLSFLMAYYIRLLNLASSIVRCGVRDTVSSASEISHINIRRAWDVVKCSPNDTENEIKVILTPAGPIFAVEIYDTED
jgi:hypothetical protein